MTGCVEDSNEHVGSVKGGQFIDQLNDYQFLKYDSAPQSELLGWKASSV
jgi:hypothetical protein